MNLKLALLLLTAVFVLACTNAAPPVAVRGPSPSPAAAPARDSHGHAEGTDAPRIKLADAKKDFDAKTAVFLDTHSPEQYAQRHIPGSINVPANNVDAYLNKIPKGKKIIAYCS